MKRLIGAAAILVLVGSPVLSGEKEKKESDEHGWRVYAGNLRADNENERKVRALYENFEDAWNRHDPQAMAAVFTVDGDYLDPDGTWARGQEEVEEHFRRGHAVIFRDSRLDIDVDTVWFITNDVALLDGSYEVVGARTPDGKEIPPRRGHLTSVLLKERGEWHVAASRLMIPQQLPYRKPAGE